MGCGEHVGNENFMEYLKLGILWVKFNNFETDCLLVNSVDFVYSVDFMAH